MIWRKKKQKDTLAEPETEELAEVKQELKSVKGELEAYKNLVDQLLDDKIDLSNRDTLKLFEYCLNQALAEKCVEQEEEIKFLKKRITYLEFLE